MKYYKNENNEVFAYDTEQVLQGLAEGKTLITKDEVLAITNPPKTDEQILAEQVQEYKLFLDKTDKKVLPDYEFKEGDNSLEWYIEERSKTRAFIRANEVI